MRVRAGHASDGKFARQPCCYCRDYRAHSTSTCPSERARADRKARRQFRAGVRALTRAQKEIA